MPDRRRFGRETYVRLKDWDNGSANAELLCAQILQVENYADIDPSHPFGGPDGTKDVVCEKDGLKFAGAVYFPREQQRFKDIKDKFVDDFAGVKKNKADAFVFMTNQKLTLSERNELIQHDQDVEIDVYHLERIAQILNYPVNYGLRQEFLEISMTSEELVALYKQRDGDYLQRLEAIAVRIEGYNTGGNSFPFIYFGNNSNPIKVRDKPTHYLKAIGGFPLYDITGSISYRELKVLGSLKTSSGSLDKYFSSCENVMQIQHQSYAPPGFAIGLGRTDFRMNKDCLIKVHLHSRNGIFNQYLRYEELNGTLTLKETLNYGTNQRGKLLKEWTDAMEKGDLFTKHLC